MHEITALDNAFSFIILNRFDSETLHSIILNACVMAKKRCARKRLQNSWPPDYFSLFQCPGELRAERVLAAGKLLPKTPQSQELGYLLENDTAKQMVSPILNKSGATLNTTTDNTSYCSCPKFRKDFTVIEACDPFGETDICRP